MPFRHGFFFVDKGHNKNQASWQPPVCGGAVRGVPRVFAAGIRGSLYPVVYYDPNQNAPVQTSTFDACNQRQKDLWVVVDYCKGAFLNPDPEVVPEEQ